jgi:hypothetical protein
MEGARGDPWRLHMCLLDQVPVARQQDAGMDLAWESRSPGHKPDRRLERGMRAWLPADIKLSPWPRADPWFGAADLGQMRLCCRGGDGAGMGPWRRAVARKPEARWPGRGRGTWEVWWKRGGAARKELRVRGAFGGGWWASCHDRSKKSEATASRSLFLR